ncbi:MAG: hypothetical protein AB7N54_02270 [Alphaproteobacteria bacterium]
MKRLAAALLLALVLAGTTATATRAAEAPEARTILALYDGSDGRPVRFTRIHTWAEMPLNWLGLRVVYRDIRDGLPDLAGYRDLRGIITWFEDDVFDDPDAYLAWANAAIDSGLRYVVLGSLGARASRRGGEVPLATINRFYGRLGLRTSDEFVDLTYDWDVLSADRAMVAFEYPLEGPLPPFEPTRATGPATRVLLSLARRDGRGEPADLVTVNAVGGVVSPGYSHFRSEEANRTLWRIDPFRFFAAAFATDDLPRPDPAVLVGRRIFYSHIDGDGWHNPSKAEGYTVRRTLSAEVVRREILERFPDLPVTVAPIGAEVDPDWYGTEEAEDIARDIFAMPNVEAGTHTHTHPFDWQYFASYSAEAERALIKRRGSRNAGLVAQGLDVLTGGRYGTQANIYGVVGDAEAEDDSGYALPRPYFKEPYTNGVEVYGSVAVIEQLLPPGKGVRVLQWSGNTRPFAAVVAATRTAGIRNLNGGDTRLDFDYPSYTTVAPVGVQVGDQRQVYASASNENTYTDLWTRNYYAFRNYRVTADNTWSPLPLKPFNIYYHMYSGERQASVRALIENYEYARAQELVPIFASHYAGIGDGFDAVRLVRLDAGVWRIESRDRLQTIRFDRADDRAVDFGRSHGVIGQRRANGRLYVALDPATAAPVLALQPAAQARATPQPAYLVHARWPVRDVAWEGESVRFTAGGFGDGEMQWQMPRQGTWKVDARLPDGTQALAATSGTDGILNFVLPTRPGAQVSVTIRPDDRRP